MQVVGYERTPDPALLVAESGSVDRIAISPGTTLEYSLGDRHCAGSRHEDVHRPCDRDTAPWCDVHADAWICARCRGTCLKDEMDCHQPHVVYLAAVAPDAIKVGVTRATRVETRFHEQGADRGAVIHDVENGRIAREIEAELGTTLPERIRTSEKIRGLTRTVDENRWESLLAEHVPIRRYRPDYDLDLSAQPIPETLASGQVAGAKGRLLVLDRGHSTYVTDMRDLVGCSVARDAETRDLQTGLGAFE